MWTKAYKEDRISRPCGNNTVDIRSFNFHPLFVVAMVQLYLIAAAMAAVAAPVAALPNDNLLARAACNRDLCFRSVRATHYGETLSNSR